MKHENEVFEQKTVLMDGHAYEKCVFKGCVLVFSGLASLELNRCTFDGCEFTFDRHAALTLRFMAAFYSQGEWGKKIIEGTFENIRRGLITKNVSLWVVCPENKTPVKVGEMDRATYESFEFGTQNIHCPQCGKDHPWTKADVKLRPGTLSN